VGTGKEYYETRDNNGNEQSGGNLDGLVHK
jgi:hypothetical protein